MNPASEPTAWSGAVTALAVAGIPLLRAFGVNVTEDQSNAVLGFLAALILFGTVMLRNRVVTTSKAHEAIQTALDTTPAPTIAGTEAQSKAILANAKP